MASPKIDYGCSKSLLLIVSGESFALSYDAIVLLHLGLSMQSNNALWIVIFATLMNFTAMGFWIVERHIKAALYSSVTLGNIKDKCR